MQTMTTSLKKQPVYWLLLGFSCLPNFILYAFARFLAFCAWHSKSSMRRVTELNLAYCFPDMDKNEREQLARQSMLETANVAVEMPNVLFQSQKQGLRRIHSVSGVELIDEILAEGKGVIVLAPHIGNWEYMGVYLTDHYDCKFMFKPVDNPAVNRLIIRARTQSGAELMPTNKAGVMGILKHLKQGGVSGILPDQVPDDANARVVASFYGQAAPTMSLVSSFSKKPNIKVVAAFAKRLSNKQFDIVFQAVDDNIYSKDAVVSATALNGAVESLIAMAPAQYQWEYKRFKYDVNGGKHALYRKDG